MVSAWLYVLICVGLACLCFFFAGKCFNDGGWILMGFVCSIVAIVMFIFAIGATANRVNVDVRTASVQEARRIYELELIKYDGLATQDVTASTSYFTLHENIVKFNNNVRMANKWEGNWFAEYFISDPAYCGETVKIE